MLGIEKTTLATGGNLEKNAKNILFSAKLTGLNNKVLLNEKDIMRDVAKASDAIKLSLGGSGKKLGEAAAQAKALGMSLEQVDKIASSLLDFESSITNELSAELITGKQINLEQARLYALNNDMAGLSREIAKNFGSVAEFGKMNRIQQEAAAKAVGMSREELATTLTDQAALKGLSGDKLKDAQAALDYARAQGMTEDQIAKQGVDNLMKQQSVQERLNNSVEKMKEIFVSIAEPILQIISPIVDILLPALSSINYIFQGISGVITGNLEGLSTTQKVIGTIVASLSAAYVVFKSLVAIQKMWNSLTFAYNIMKAFGNNQAKQGILLSLRQFAIDKGRAIMDTISTAMKTFPIPIIGAVLAAAAAATGIAYINSQAKPMVTGGEIPEGYENDTYPALLSSGETVITKPMTSKLNDENFHIKTLNPFKLQQQQQSQPLINFDMSETNSLLGKLLNKEGSVYMDSGKVGTTVTLGMYKTP